MTRFGFRTHALHTTDFATVLNPKPTLRTRHCANRLSANTFTYFIFSDFTVGKETKSDSKVRYITSLKRGDMGIRGKIH